MGQNLPSGDDRDRDTLSPHGSAATPNEGPEKTLVGSPHDNALPHTVDEDGDPEATIECPDSDAATADADPDQTAVDQQLAFEAADPEQTVDGNGAPEMTIGAPLHTDDADSGTSVVDVEQTIAQQWRDTFTEETTPELTIKSDPEQTMADDFAFSFSLKSREVSRDGMAPIENPDYVREQMLGEGGIGAVYAARQKSIDRHVAIKVLKSRSARRESSRNSFVSEAKITGELDHPNIVPVYDLALDDGSNPFYVMKQVQGVEWADTMGENSLRENLDVLMRTADAIALAHARGFIHRDLKPANIMLGEFGEVLVMDWGLAVPTADNPKQKSFPKARFGGTPCYMAPEMASGPVENVDRRSDIYLLGAILFEILTGSTPHPKKTVKECLHAAAQNEIASTDVSGLLMEIARKAMATSQSDRYQTVPELQGAIREYFHHLESISLAERAQEEFAAARLSDEYDDYARAVFAFEESHGLWSGNEVAQAGLSAARLAYAESALQKKDHDLCGSVLDMDDPAHTALRLRLFEEVAESKRLEVERQRRLQRIQRVVAGLVGLVVVIIIVAFFSINSSLSRARYHAEAAGQSEREAIAQGRIARRQVARLHEARGMSFVHSEDDAAGLVHLAEALAQELEASRLAKPLDGEDDSPQLEPGTPRTDAAAVRSEERDVDLAVREGEHRVRLAGMLHRMPRLLQLWHIGPASSAEFSSDGQRVLVMTSDGRAHLRDVVTGRAVFAPLEHGGVGLSARLSPDGRFIVTCTKEDGIRQWDALTGRLIRKLCETGIRKFAKFSPDSRLLVTTSEYTPLLSDAESGEFLEKRLPGSRTPIRDIVFAPDSRILAFSSNDGTVRLVDTQTGEETARLDTRGMYSGGPGQLEFSPDGRRLFANRGSRLWDVATGKSVFDRLEVSASTARFTPDGRRLVGGTTGGQAFVCDAETGKLLVESRLHVDWIVATAVSPDGRIAATGGYDRFLRIWDTRTGQLLWSPLRHTRHVHQLQFSPDGRRLLAVAAGGEVRIWQLVSDLLLTGRIVHNESVNLVRFLPSEPATDHGEPMSHRVVSASSDGTVQISDAETGRPIVPPLAHGSAVRRIEFSSDGRRLATAGKTASIWDTQTGRRFMGPFNPIGGRFDINYSQLSPDGQQVLLGYAGSFNIFDLQARRDIHSSLQGTAAVIQFLEFSPDARRVLTGCAEGVQLWDCETGQRVWRVDHRHGLTLWLPDGHRIVSCSNGGNVEMLDAETGEVVDEFFVERTLGLTCSPDGRFLAARYLRGETRVWEIATHKPVTRALTHDGPVLHVAFSPPHPDDPHGGRRLVTASEDGTARVWNVETGQEILLLRHAAPVRAAEFSSDARQIVTACDDGSARVWTLPQPVQHSPEHLKHLARVLSSLALDDRLGLETIEPEEAARAWEELRKHSASVPDDTGAVTWHRGQLVQAEAQEDWFAVAFQSKHLLANDPDVTGEDQAALHRRHGDALLRLARFDAAIESYSAALTYDAADALVQFQRGRALARTGRFAEALKGLIAVSKQLESASPSAIPSLDPAAVWLMQSIVQVQLEQSNESDDAFGHASDLQIRLQPERPWDARIQSANPQLKLWREIATELTIQIDGTGEDEDSAATESGSVKVPGWLWRARGLVWSALGNWPEAAADFGRATALQPDDPHAWHGLARALAETAPDSKAGAEARAEHAKRLIAAAGQLVELAPNDWSARRLRVRGLLGQQQREAALVDLAAAIDIADVNAEMRLLSGQTRLHLRQFESAAADFMRAVELDPDNVQTRYRCAGSCAEAEQWGKAADHLSEVVRSVGARVNPQLLYQLAQVSLAADRRESYHHACSALVKMAEKTGDLNLGNTAAWACALAPDAIENLDRCVKLSAKAVAASPNSYPHLNTSGAILVRAGRHEEALKQLDAAIAAHGTGGTALDWLFQSFAHEALGEKDEARKLVEKAAVWFEQVEAGKLKSRFFKHPLAWGDRVEFGVLLDEARSRTDPKPTR